MSDREKVIKGLKTIKQFFGYGLPSTAEMFDSYYGTLNDAITMLKEQPEIVRCKDCIHYRKDTCSAGAGIAFPPPDDWFCADGERNEGGEVNEKRVCR